MCKDTFNKLINLVVIALRSQRFQVLSLREQSLKIPVNGNYRVQATITA